MATAGNKVVATISGGSGSYTVEVKNGSQTADGYNGASPYTYTYETADGTGVFVINVVDANDATKTGSAQFAVTSAPIPLNATINSSAIHVGDSVAVTITSGSGDYNVEVFNGTSSVHTEDLPANATSYVYTASAVGNYKITVTDKTTNQTKDLTFDVTVVPSTFTNFIGFRTAADTGTVPATTTPFTYIDEGHQTVEIPWHDAPLQIRGGNYVKGSTTEVVDGMKGTTYSMSDTSIVSVIHDTTDESLFTIDGSKAGSTVFTVLSADGKAKGELVFTVTGTGP